MAPPPMAHILGESKAKKQENSENRKPRMQTDRHGFNTKQKTKQLSCVLQNRFHRGSVFEFRIEFLVFIRVHPLYPWFRFSSSLLRFGSWRIGYMNFL